VALDTTTTNPHQPKSSFPLPSSRFLLGATSQQSSQKKDHSSSGDPQTVDSSGWDPWKTKTLHEDSRFPKKSFIFLVEPIMSLHSLKMGNYFPGDGILKGS
jgi:hypothetical protein